MKLKKHLFFSLGIIIFFIIVTVIVIISLYNNYNEYYETRELEYKSNLIANELRQTSDDLTRFARTYILTGDTSWERKYWNVLKIRNGEKARPDGHKIALLDSIRKLDLTPTELQKLKKAEQNSNKLVYTEKVAFNAIKGLYDNGNGDFTIKGKPDTAMAQRIIFDKKYHKDKELIMKPIDDFVKLVKRRTSKKSRIIDKKNINLIIAIISILLLTFIFSILAYFYFYKKINNQFNDLNKEKQKQRRILDTFKEGIYINNEDFKIEYANSSLQKKLGKDIIGKTCYKELYNLNEKCNWCIYEKLKTKKYIEYEYDNKKGKVLIVDNLLLENNNKLTIFYDISERKKVENIIQQQIGKLRMNEKELRQNIEELKATKDDLSSLNEEYLTQNEEYEALNEEYKTQNEDLKLTSRELEIAEFKANQANKLKSEFLSNMSHEIRTPMNAILGFSEILKSKINKEENKLFVNRIEASGKLLLNLINEILDLSKIEAGQLNIIKEPTDLYNVIYKTANMFSALSKQKNIPINVRIDNTVPKNIITDEHRLNQILVNLVGNALKFTKKGSIDIIVSSKKNTKKNFVEISIKVIDTGIGIPANQLNSIFETFRQVEGQKTRQYGGTGLGLAITKKLVKLMGGKINVVSQIGKGTAFVILFKNIEFVQNVIEHVGTKSIQEKSVIIEKKIKILHVEDNDMNREIISLFIEEFNFELKEAVNGKDAIDLLEDFTPDLILMDIQMPVLNGYEATKIIRNNKKLKNIPIIALTANATVEDKKKYQYVFDGYITKPVIRKEFIKTILKYIN